MGVDRIVLGGLDLAVERGEGFLLVEHVVRHAPQRLCLSGQQVQAKPFTPAVLLQAVRQAFEGGEGSEGLGGPAGPERRDVKIG